MRKLAGQLQSACPNSPWTVRFFTKTVCCQVAPVASIIGTFVQPLVDWGARKAEVERNKALYVERLAGFTQSYLEAIEDVENALYQERKQREFLRLLEIRLELLERTVEETTQRYANGLTDYLPVLDAVKELAAARASHRTTGAGFVGVSHSIAPCFGWKFAATLRKQSIRRRKNENTST